MTTTFAQLGVPKDLIFALAEQGIESPFAIQSLAIGDAMDGRDVCGKAKTGSGKTLAFSLPAIAHTERHEEGKPTTLVLTPTRELANQIAGVVKPLATVRQLRTIAVYD